MGRQGYSAEFSRKVLDLLAAGRSVASVAHEAWTSAIRRSITGAGRTGLTEVTRPV
jgi:hypothetical protein